MRVFLFSPSWLDKGDRMKQDNKTFKWSNISPRCITRMLLHNLWMIVAAALLFAMGASLCLNLLHTPMYRASMSYAITSRKTSYVSNNNLKASQEVSAVFEELLETNVIVKSIKKHSPELSDFNGTISAALTEESNLITVYAEDDSPKDALVSLNALVEIFPELSDYISKNTVAQVIKNPTVSANPINGIDRQRIVVLAGLAGGFSMMALLCWMSIRRETVQTRSGARNLLDAPIISTVGHERKHRTLKSALTRARKGVQVFAPTTSYTYIEQINNICSRFEHEKDSNNKKVFLVGGVGENEGKSTVAGNIASMLAMKGNNVALVDCDFRKPALNRFFNHCYKMPKPLNKLLSEPLSKENLVNCMMRHPDMPLFMLFPDSGDADHVTLIRGATMKNLIKQLRAFDYVIIDTPPMGFFTDAEVLAEIADATLLVVRQDGTPAADVNDAADILRKTKSTFLGCVLNDMIGVGIDGYGYGYGYGYGRYGRYGKYGYGGRYGYGYGHSHQKKSNSKTKEEKES